MNNNKEKNDILAKKIDYIQNAFMSKEEFLGFLKEYPEELGVDFPTEGSEKFIRIARMEDTPSCHVFEKEFIGWMDFGAGVSGDIIKLVRENFDLNYPQGVELIYKLLTDGNDDIDLNNLPKKKYTPKPIEYAKNMNPIYFDYRRKDRKNHYKRFMQIMRGFTRTLSDNKIIKLAKFLDIGYDNEFDRVYLPEIDGKDNYVGFYAYNRDVEPYTVFDKKKQKEVIITPSKGMIRKNQKPNLTGSHLLKIWNIELPIILAEGHTDFVNLIGNGYRAITVGAATKTIKPFLYLLKGRTIHIWYDDDLPGIKGTERIMKEILDFNDTVSLKDRIICKPMFWSLEIDTEVSTPENRGKVFTAQMKNRIIKQFQIGKENVFWGKRKKKGYDFTDLLLEFNDIEPNKLAKIKQYLSQYKKEEKKTSMF